MSDGESDDLVAIAVYGQTGEWDFAEILKEDATTAWNDTKSEYAKVTLVRESKWTDVLQEYGITEYEIVHPADAQEDDDE